jgi:hypothetical protein
MIANLLTNNDILSMAYTDLLLNQKAGWGKRKGKELASKI